MEALSSFFGTWLVPTLLLAGWVITSLISHVVKPLDAAQMRDLPEEVRRRLKD